MQIEIQTAKIVAYVSFLVLTTILVVYATIVLFDNISIIGKASGQLLSSSPSSSSSASSSSNPLSVEIVYPDEGQATNVKSNLEISGIASYNPGYVCHVSVIINDVKPYQKTTPTGSNIENDYSKWKYVVDSDYTTIREEDNKITARLLCSGDQGEDMRKWDSVNVTGQAGTENNYQSSTERTLAIPIDTESTSGISSTTIEIDRNVLIELINDRIDNNTETIRDSIEDSIMSVYTNRMEYDR